MDAYLTKYDGSDVTEESGRPAHLGNFVREIADDSEHPHLSAMLGDIACLFTIESAYRENLPLPVALSFTHNPRILMEHLNMGITDIEELAAFVPEDSGNYRPVPAEGGLSFTLESK